MRVSNKVSQKASQIIVFVLIFVSFYGCGSYQSAYNVDGIYETQTVIPRETVVVQDQSNYFSEQLEKINVTEENK